MAFRRLMMAMALAVGATLMTGAMVPATGGVAPYCIATGSGGEGGGIRTGRCEFFDYQQCLQAAASGGNCVQNIDYHGEPPPAATPSRRRR